MEHSENNRLSSNKKETDDSPTRGDVEKFDSTGPFDPESIRQQSTSAGDDMDSMSMEVTKDATQ